ncbi:hypothetical protein Tco_1284407 [Tanacetum coccineum]
MASVCPLSTPWFGGTSVVKDPLSVDEAVDLPCVELLNENRTLIKKYPEIFLCFVGLSRSFVETNVRPTLLRDNDEEISLLDFVKSADPFKVKVGEQNLVENEVLLNTETKDRVISPSPQIISLVDHTIQDELNVNSGKRKKKVAFVSGSPPVKKPQTEGIVISDSQPSTAGKSPTALQRLIRQGEQAAAGSGSAAPATEDATSSSITPTLEHALEDALHDNVRTRPPTGCFVVLSSSSADTDIPAASQVVPLVSSSHAGVSVPATESAGDGHPLSVPEFETGVTFLNFRFGGVTTGTLSTTPSHGSSADDFYESQTIESATAMNVLLDNVTPPGYWAALRNQSDVGFLNAFNINSAQHICMAYELRLCYEHEIMTRKKFEKKFTDSAAAVQRRDAEVAELKAGEVASLTTQNAGLLKKVSVVELERDSLKIQVMSEGKMRE